MFLLLEWEEKSVRLRENFILCNTGDRQVLVDVTGKFPGLIRMNETGAFIVECMKKETTKEEIAGEIFEKYDQVSLEQADAEIEKVIAALKKADALAE